MEKEETEKKVGFFTDENGSKSMRRLLAFIFAFAELIAVACTAMFVEEWKLGMVICTPFLIGCILMMFFTSWSDISNVVKAVKKGDK